MVTIHWFRRDLRIEDNAALYYALKGDNPVQCIFIFDTEILDELTKKDARVEFIHQEISRLALELKSRGSFLDVRVGKPLNIWKQLTKEYHIDQVYANRDYEPYARKRDKSVYDYLASKGISFKARKDHVIFEKEEVLKKDGTPYTVFTPYNRSWREKLTEYYLQAYPSSSINNWNRTSSKPVPALKTIGFVSAGIEFPAREIRQDVVSDYHNSRDIPAVQGTSRLSIHLRFGTISIRNLVQSTKDLNAKYLNELIWREFYQAILWHFPHVEHENFNSRYDHIVWRNDDEEFKRWCEGRTGYPIVDAGMRELNDTGFMHNRVRMIVASFLTKHLLTDWRRGEAYFARKLLDFESASNNGGWQWAAGTGVDAAPYFRIFNPYVQTQKFDPNLKYVKKWVPELETKEYPKPMVDHKFARQRALEAYKEALELPQKKQ